MPTELEKLEARNIETIHVKKAAVKWIRPGKEIEINGKLFDVKSLSEDGESYTIKGLYDEKEARLIAAEKKVQQQSHNNSPAQQALAKITAPILFFEKIKDFTFQSGIIIKSKFSVSNQKDFLSYCPELLSPPPKV